LKIADSCLLRLGFGDSLKDSRPNRCIWSPSPSQAGLRHQENRPAVQMRQARLAGGRRQAKRRDRRRHRQPRCRHRRCRQAAFAEPAPLDLREPSAPGPGRANRLERGPLESLERPRTRKHVLPAAPRHPPDPGERRLRRAGTSQTGPKPAVDARPAAPDRQSRKTRSRLSSDPLRFPAFGPAAKAAGSPEAP